MAAFPIYGDSDRSYVGTAIRERGNTLRMSPPESSPPPKWKNSLVSIAIIAAAFLLLCLPLLVGVLR
jgi:hypothetical protein